MRWCYSGYSTITLTEAQKSVQAKVMVLSSFMVSLAELSHVASVISVVVCCLLMLGFLLRMCGQDLLQGAGVGWHDDHRQNLLSKIFSTQRSTVTNVKPIELFVGIKKVVRLYKIIIIWTNYWFKEAFFDTIYFWYFTGHCVRFGF